MNSDLYLNLMKKCLINEIYWEGEMVPLNYQDISPLGKVVYPLLSTVENMAGVRVMKKQRFTLEDRMRGIEWSPVAHTMIGVKRLENIQSCIEDILENNIPGDLIETGVWRGGATIFMRAVLRAYNIADKKVWVADSFEGLPKPDEKYPEDTGDVYYAYRELAIPLETVKKNFRKYDLLDDQVCFLKGWFKDTLPSAPIKELALLRLDGDMYESTMDALKSLYPLVSPGGYVIIDDYGVLKGCRLAVLDYRKEHGIDSEIISVDHSGVFWKKGSA